MAVVKDLPKKMQAHVHVVSATGCWEWTGGRIGKGYGAICWNGTQEYAHRASYEALVGKIPAGLDIDHLCRNRACINPLHLEAVTRGENLRRSPLLVAESRRKIRKLHEQSRGKPGTKFAERNGNSKLTSQRASWIRQLTSLGVPRRAFVAMYGVSKSAIDKIVQGKTWTRLIGA